MTTRRPSVSLKSHGRSGYRFGCRCDVCRAAETKYMRGWRAAHPKQPCAVCNRVHPGRCTPPEDLSVNVTVTMPASLHSRMAEQVPWGERSKWVAGLVARELT